MGKFVFQAVLELNECIENSSESQWLIVVDIKCRKFYTVNINYVQHSKVCHAFFFLP